MIHVGCAGWSLPRQYAAAFLQPGSHLQRYAARLGAVERTSFGAEANWDVPIGGRLSTNIAAVQQADGGLLVGAGHEGEVLRIWLP